MVAELHSLISKESEKNTGGDDSRSRLNPQDTAAAAARRSALSVAEWGSGIKLATLEIISGARGGREAAGREGRP